MAALMRHARTLSVAVLSIAALAVGGCGGDDSGGGGGGGGGGSDDEAQIRDIVSNYATAIADRDGDKACSYLTDAARQQLESLAKTLDVDDCPAVMEKVTEDVSSDDRDKLADITITSVKVNGDRAVVQVEADGVKGDPSTLIKQGDDWKIDVNMNGSGTATANSATVTAERPSVATVTTP
jgi:hypothetical protein